jgi:hypothetical protein
LSVWLQHWMLPVTLVDTVGRKVEWYVRVLPKCLSVQLSCFRNVWRIWTNKTHTWKTKYGVRS